MKQLPKIKDVQFIDGLFHEHKPENMLVYCDPPYQGTTQYGAFSGFDHNLFWETMRDWSKNNTVVISEYNAPEDFKCVAEFSSQMGLTTGNERPKRTEKLFMYNGTVWLIDGHVAIKKWKETNLRRKKMKTQHWCMCEKLKAVARDGHSTCSICGGKDAYGLSTERPDDKKKTITNA